MRFGGRRRRAGVSEILATVLLVAITLISGAALASFVFSTMKTTSTTATLSIMPGSVQCFRTDVGSITPPGGSAVTIPINDCGMIVQNTGVQKGLIIGTGPGSTFLFDGCNGADATSCLVPENGFAVVELRFSGTPAQQVSGYLGQTNGPVLLFSIILP